MFFNQVIIIGNITKDPELKSLPSGNKIASFSVATNRVWKEKDGTKKEQTDFHNVLVFGKQAETVAQYMKKGSQILVRGRLQTRSWDDKDGKKVYRTEIVSDIVQFGSKPKETTPASAPVAQGATQPPQRSATVGNTDIEYPDDDIDASDIPF